MAKKVSKSTVDQRIEDLESQLHVLLGEWYALWWQSIILWCLAGIIFIGGCIRDSTPLVIASLFPLGGGVIWDKLRHAKQDEVDEAYTALARLNTAKQEGER